MTMRDDYRDSQVLVGSGDIDDGFDAFDSTGDEADPLENESGSGLRAKLVETLVRVAELEADNEAKGEAIVSRDLDEAFSANGLDGRKEGFVAVRRFSN